jgi:hypothetical protein
MTDDELRALVREAIARHAAGADATTGGGGGVLSGAASHHASHGVFVLPTGSDADGPCIIEPAVTCNHCGYCKSLGH